MNINQKAWRTQIGARVREQRERQGMTLAEMAEQTGLEERHLQLLEDGRRNITLEAFARICLVLRVSADYLSCVDTVPLTDESDLPD